MFSKISILKSFAIFTRKHLCWSLVSIQLQSSSPTTILKSNSSTDVFLWTLPNFEEHLFWKTSANDCFWNLMKVFFIMKYYHSERHGVKVGPGPWDPEPPYPSQSLKVGPQDFLQSLKVRPFSPFFNEFIFFRIFLRFFTCLFLYLF